MLNSLGLKYAEKCVSCQHNDLCFLLLEFAGCITQEDMPICVQCEKVIENPQSFVDFLNENGFRMHC
jgi:hypothetical protein